MNSKVNSNIIKKFYLKNKEIIKLINKIKKELIHKK